MESIGIIIPTRDRKEFLINCIDSILNSSISNYDIYVVDNASKDNIAEVITKKYEHRVFVIRNEIGKGSSGGFNTGLRIAMKKTYKYLLCCDDDVVFDSNALKELYKLMESDNSIGIAGSKIYNMNDENRLQEYGSFIDFEKFDVSVRYKNQIDNGETPEIIYCDYVPACSMIIRKDVLSKIGLMNEENFVYWDDMDICYRAKLAGYKVAAYSKSIVWHKMNGSSTNKDAAMVHSYYFNRNRINFFIKYCNEKKLTKFCDFILEELFRITYGCLNKQRINRLIVARYSYDDAIYGRLGKADYSRILPSDITENNLQKILKGASSIIINNKISEREAKRLVDEIKIINPKIIVYKYLEASRLEEEGKTINIIICNNIYEIVEYNISWIYIDKQGNFITNRSEFEFWKNYNEKMKAFVDENKPVFMTRARLIRNNKVEE